MVARRKLFTYQVTYSVPGISSSKITEKTSGGRHKSSYNIERFRGPPFLLLLQNYIKLLIFVVSSFCPMIPLSPLVQILHPPILLTPFLSLKILIMNVIRDCLRVKNFAQNDMQSKGLWNLYFALFSWCTNFCGDEIWGISLCSSTWPRTTAEWRTNITFISAFERNTEIYSQHRLLEPQVLYL